MRNRFHTIRVVFGTLGSLLIVLGGLLLIPLFIALIYGELATPVFLAFLIPSGIAFGSGFLLSLIRPKIQLNEKEAVLICGTAWLAFSAIGGLPFLFSFGASYLDSFFETMSGLTTTGITVFSGLDFLPRSILFWRSLLQWIGGLGILTLFLAIISIKGGGHRLFGAESHKIESVRPVPGLVGTIRILWIIYTGFTVFIILLLTLFGMPLFDSVCNSFTALSTGGFVPHDASISWYAQEGYAFAPLFEYILILGMFLGGANFLIHYRLFRGDARALFDTTEMRLYLGFLFGFTLLIMAEHLLRHPSLFTSHTEGFPDILSRLESIFRTSFFQTTSILTTTGFATQNIAGPFFGGAARLLFLVMMVIGGCVGSTGGGIKVLRVGILLKLVKREVGRLWKPKESYVPLLLDGKRIDPVELSRVYGIVAAWLVLLVIGGLFTAFFTSYTAIESFSGMASALGNIGPCYIPDAGMRELPAVIKVLYIFGMAAGRLEILPVLLLVRRKAWF
ncbi:MAG: TrkH family potassium uptake protein [Spirochaetales bacterium]|nr:TrkH family potassium uptake protein [Spirochaetales bacterium]